MKQTKRISPKVRRQQTNTALIRTMLRHRGPLYVAALYPEDGITAGDQGIFNPWFIAHVDNAKLSQKELDRVGKEFNADAVEFPDFMETFTAFLESRGYIVLHSADPPQENGNGYLTVDRYRAGHPGKA